MADHDLMLSVSAWHKARSSLLCILCTSWGLQIYVCLYIYVCVCIHAYDFMCMCIYLCLNLFVDLSCSAQGPRVLSIPKSSRVILHLVDSKVLNEWLISLMIWCWNRVELVECFCVSHKSNSDPLHPEHRVSPDHRCLWPQNDTTCFIRGDGESILHLTVSKF